MKWFKHDADANADAKLQNVLLDYGLEGYGLYWYCVELIAGKVDVDNLTFHLEHDARIIARNTGSTHQKVEEMMRYFVKVGLFECSENVITCLKMAKRLDKSMTSNPMMRTLIEKIKSENHDSVMTDPDFIMQDKIRLDENREEKIKTKKGKSEDFVFPENLNKEAWQLWIDYRKASGIKAYRNNALSAGRVINSLIEMSGGDMKVQMQIVDISMRNGWTGLFPLKPGLQKRGIMQISHPNNEIPDGFQ